jgi:hypothetical protein
MEISEMVTVASAILSWEFEVVESVLRLLLVDASLMLSSKAPLPSLIELVESQPTANRRPKATTAESRIGDRYFMVRYFMGGNTSFVIESTQIVEVKNGPTSGMPFASRIDVPKRLCRRGRRWQNPDSGRAERRRVTRGE